MRKFRLAGLGLGWLVILLGQGPLVAGQINAPGLNSLLVELWPEYDRAEVLVIYHAELSPTTPLPAELTFRLPAHIEAMHVVAVEQNGRLFQAPSESFSLQPEGEATLLTLSVPTARFQFEYYDPEILRRQAAERRLNFQFLPPYEIKQATFQIQEPIGTTEFSSIPPAENSFIGQDGLNYSRFQATNLTPSEPISLAASYRRSTDALSAQHIAGVPVQNPTTSAAVVSPATAAPVDNSLTFGYILIGTGTLLFLAAAGSWWWSRRQPVGADPDQLRQREGATFCYRCGTALRGQANFCHSCGAERRSER